MTRLKCFKTKIITALETKAIKIDTKTKNKTAIFGLEMGLETKTMVTRSDG